jgi:predicted metal-binding membrane protein
LKITDATSGNFERATCARAISERAFLAVAALLFAASAAVTIVGCNSMSAMGGMAMAGGWTMSMAWMRMPGQSWVEASSSFVGIWVVMMAAMMLPSPVPVLSRYRRAIGGTENIGRLTALVGAGYFSVWTHVGNRRVSAGGRAGEHTEEMLYKTDRRQGLHHGGEQLAFPALA